ncbi:MAG: hypothetical protein L0Y72_09815 [Gemmataceae bacterium]|nr:hypothetical protein [Gemmataceae bacterium]MCI0739328.1 hypothetical protein [Gemmataceae bacterium]
MRTSWSYVWSTVPRSRVGLVLTVVLAATLGSARLLSQAPSAPVNPYPYAADEPKAKVFSLSKAAEYLDGVARFWMQPNSCGACHANFAYLMARPLLGETPLVAETRAFLERRKEANPRVFSFDAEAVGVAFALAWDDAHNGRVLRPKTKAALFRMWDGQRGDGTWPRLGCGECVPSENDKHYTAALAVLATGLAPDGYAKTQEPKDRLTLLRRYFTRTPPKTLHDEALLLWASLYADGLLTTAERDNSIRSLLARQHSDGGWSFADLMVRPRPNSPLQKSDGYGTALVLFVLRQASVPADRPALASGLNWLRNNQRASGRWFTPTDTAGHPTEGQVGARDLYVQNLGTAFAVLALKGPGPKRTAAVDHQRVLSDAALTALVQEANQFIRQSLQDLSAKGVVDIRANALLLALGAQNRMGQKDLEARVPATLRDVALTLAQEAKQRPSNLAPLLKLADSLSRFPNLDSDPDAKLVRFRLQDQFDHDDVVTLFGGCGIHKGQHRIEATLAKYAHPKAPLTSVESDKLELVAYKVALLGEFNRELDELVASRGQEKRKQWVGFADDLSDRGWELAGEIRSGRFDAAKTALQRVQNACISCHAQFRD